jgi:SAM-dependent methyltransferase
MHCPLCRAGDCRLFHTDRLRHYYLCPQCDLVFVPSIEQVSIDEERSRYARHDNTLANAGYRTFLGEIADAVCGLPYTVPAILDFGSGENRVLEALLADHGYRCASYDPLYDIGIEALAETYDIVVMCEVIEHLRTPADEFARVKKLLRPKGCLVLRTRIRPNDGAFRTWWYKEDPTHIGFYSVKSLERVAKILGADELMPMEKEIWVMRQTVV